MTANRKVSLTLIVLTILTLVAAAIGVSVTAHAVAIPIPGTAAAYEDSKGIVNYNQPDSYSTADGDPAKNTPTNCCGEADAYWADEFETNDEGNLVAIVTDPRDDNQFHRGVTGAARVHVPIGTRVEIPQRKIITFPQQPPNKTHHGWVWLSPYTDENNDPISWNVICYLSPDAS
jgi:hypothetical protein